MEKKEKKLLKKNRLLKKERDGFYSQFIFLYTGIFAVMAFAVFSGFIYSDATLLRTGDSYHQHYKALMYFASYVREILRNIIFEHRFVIPQFDFSIGLGSDVISTFAYYSLGDPFCFLSFLVPIKYIHYYYQAMEVIRLYCAGLSFSYLCYKTGKKNMYAVLAGSFTYCFSVFALYSGLKHPYFVNPMVFLPLIVLGVENILKGKSFLLLAAMVAISEISNFYFFYMLVLLTVIYVAVRLITVYKTDIKKMLAPFVKIALSSLLGVGMGMFLFLPVVFAFLGDERVSAEGTFNLFYYVNTYKMLPVSFLTVASPSPWLHPGVSVLFFPSVAVMLAQKKKDTHLKILLLISIIFMCFPIFGKIFNGFSYVCNRWCFGFILLASFIIVSSWNKLLSAQKVEVRAVFISMVVVIATCLLMNHSKNSQAIVPLVLLFAIALILCLVYFKKLNINTKTLQPLFLVFALLSILNYSFYMFSSSGDDYMAEFNTSKKFESMEYVSNTAVLEASKDDTDEFWRYTGRKISRNAAFLADLKSTQYYWSLSNGNISKFRSEMNISEIIPYYYWGFDARTALNSLASVKYFVNDKNTNKSVPYGYSKTERKGVWVNNYPLPFGYTYDSYVTKAELDALSDSVKKQETMIKSVVLEEDTDRISKAEIKPSAIELDYEINCLGKNVSMQDGKIIVTKAGAEIELIFDPVENAETYFSISGIDFVSTNLYELYSDDKAFDPMDIYNFDDLDEEGKEKVLLYKNSKKDKTRTDITLVAESSKGQSFENTLIYFTSDGQYYTGRKDFDINMGCTKSGMNKIKVTFDSAGVYTFDELKVIAQPMTGYEDNINALKQNVMENVVIDYNTVTGSISLEEDKVLCMSVPYSDGWTAYVDGEKAELLKVNGMYSGLILTEGEHEIELRYSTPGFKLGIIISVFSLAIFLFLVYYNLRRKNGGQSIITLRKKGM